MHHQELEFNSQSIIKIHRNNLCNKLHGISYEHSVKLLISSVLCSFFFLFISILASLSLTKTKQIFVDHLKWVWFGWVCTKAKEKQPISYYIWNVCAAISIGKICAQKVSNLFRSKMSKTDRKYTSGNNKMQTFAAWTAYSIASAGEKRKRERERCLLNGSFPLIKIPSWRHHRYLRINLQSEYCQLMT